MKGIKGKKKSYALHLSWAKSKTNKEGVFYGIGNVGSLRLF